MKRAASRLISTVLCIALCGMLAACNKGSANLSDKGQASGTASYPIKTDVTLTYWIPNTYLPTNITKWQDVPYLVDLQKRTGINVNYIISTGTDAQQAFNLMISSGNLPDIIDDLLFSGGAQAGLDNKYIIKLNDLLPKYAPNFYKYLKSRPDIDKMVKTDSGAYVGFPLVRGDDGLCSFNGLMLRKDWLDDVGLQVPATIDDWTKALTAFKTQKNVTAPLLLASDNAQYYSAFSGAYGIDAGFYVDNGKVKFGADQPAYKDFLNTMHEWYSQGLIDKNFATSNQTARNAAMTSGTAGSTFGAMGGGIGNYLNAAIPTNPKYDLVAAPYPTLKSGAKPEFGYKSVYANTTGCSAITTACKHPDIAARFLDYGYSEEGHMFYNFGTQGVSYNMVNGTPVYTALITHNPKGLTMAQALSYYTGASTRGSGFAQDMNYYNQYCSLPEQQNAIKVWADTNESKHQMPPISMTSAESTEYWKLITDINTYVSESTVKFIMGVTPISTFDSYLNDLSKLNVNRAVQINQTALDRYNKR